MGSKWGSNEGIRIGDIFACWCGPYVDRPETNYYQVTALRGRTQVVLRPLRIHLAVQSSLTWFVVSSQNGVSLLYSTRGPQTLSFFAQLIVPYPKNSWIPCCCCSAGRPPNSLAAWSIYTVCLCPKDGSENISGTVIPSFSTIRSIVSDRRLPRPLRYSWREDFGKSNRFAIASSDIFSLSLYS